jgi:protein SCO1
MACWQSIRRASALAACVVLGACAGRELPKLGEVASFQLTEQTGQAFDVASLRGKVWIADFMFTTCPGPCPRMSSQMHGLQMELESQGVQLVSFTVDPGHDTPPVLAEYAKKFKASQGVWHFLTGQQAELHRLARDVFKLGVVDGSLEHSTRFVLVDGEGQIRGYYLTSDAEAMARLLDDARELL